MFPLGRAHVHAHRSWDERIQENLERT